MRGDKKVIEILNDVLTGELTAINQYFLHSEMLANWGYSRLHKKVRKESIDEMLHAETLMERVLYLGGLPNVQRLGPIRIGENVEEMLRSDLALEEEALPRLNEGIKHCRAVGDNGTRGLLEDILRSEEEHVDWIEAQLDQIGQMGLENYLAAQVRKEEE
ncbi:MAG: bacterioferritin [Myxococcales bacterium]|nr:bacterioferritin [Myxococcales bacterium]